MTTPTLLSVTATSATTITLHFSSAVTAGDGNIVISDGHSQSYVGLNGLSTRIVGANDTRTIDDDSSALTYSGTDIVIHLDSALASGVTYSVTMDAGAVLATGSSDANARIGSTTLYTFVASGTASTVATPSAVVSSTIHFTDTGVSTDYITTALEQTVTGSYTGTLGSNDFIQVSLDNGASWHKATVSNGTWSYSGVIDTDNLTSADGDALNGTLLARVSNTAGGSSTTASQAYVYSDGMVSSWVLPLLHLSADTGADNDDQVTSVAEQTVSGATYGILSSGETVQVSTDGGGTWIDGTASDGTWQAHVTLASGSNELLMRVVDSYGSVSEISSASYTLLTSAPTLSGRALTLAQGSDSGSSGTDGVTNSASAVTLSVAGLHGLHAGDTIEIVDASNSSVVVGSYVIQTGDLFYGTGDYLSVGQYNSNERSTIDIVLSTTLSDGTHTLAARIVDTAGNIGVASAVTTVVTDSSAPTISSSAPLEGELSVNTGLDTLTFTFSEDIVIADGTQITISADNLSNSQVITLSSADVSGHTLTVHLDSPLSSGTSYTVQGATISDLAGNVGIASDTPMLHFTTYSDYVYPIPAAPDLSFVDSAPASASDSASALHTDGITNNNVISVSGIVSGLWYYRLSSTGDWIQGSGDSFTLADGTYAMDQIQVKQNAYGYDSEIASIHQDLTIDTSAPTAYATGIRYFFSAGASSLNGSVHGSTSFDNEIVEITFDHGATWVQASTTYVSSGLSHWEINGISSVLGDNYGVRLVDLAGNVSSYATLGSSNPQYFLSNDGVTFSGADDIVVFGGTGADTITVGNHSVVYAGDTGGAGDTVVAGNDAEITVGDNSTVTAGLGSTVTTGNGSNTVTVLSGEVTVNTGSGDDLIVAGSIGGLTVNAGAGDDTLRLDYGINLPLGAFANVTGVETLLLNNALGNQLIISDSAAVTHFTSGSTLTIDAIGAHTDTIHLSEGVWSQNGSQGDYNVYQNSGGTVILLIATNINVDYLT